MRNLVPFVQFKKREKQPWRSVNFSKVAGFSDFVRRLETLCRIAKPVIRDAGGIELTTFDNAGYGLATPTTRSSRGEFTTLPNI